MFSDNSWEIRFVDYSEVTLVNVNVGLYLKFVLYLHGQTVFATFQHSFFLCVCVFQRCAAQVEHLAVCENTILQMKSELERQ